MKIPYAELDLPFFGMKSQKNIEIIMSFPPFLFGPYVLVDFMRRAQPLPLFP